MVLVAVLVAEAVVVAAGADGRGGCGGGGGDGDGDGSGKFPCQTHKVGRCTPLHPSTHGGARDGVAAAPHPAPPAPTVVLEGGRSKWGWKRNRRGVKKHQVCAYPEGIIGSRC